MKNSDSVESLESKETSDFVEVPESSIITVRDSLRLRGLSPTKSISFKISTVKIGFYAQEKYKKHYKN